MLFGWRPLYKLIGLIFADQRYECLGNIYTFVQVGGVIQSDHVAILCVFASLVRLIIVRNSAKMVYFETLPTFC